MRMPPSSSFLRFVFVLLCCCSLAQEDNRTYQLSGFVKDVSSGETLPGATVYLKGTKNGVSSNIYGFYSIPLSSDKHTLVISYIGYNTTEIEVQIKGENQTLDLEIADNSVLIEEVVVVGRSKDRDRITSTEVSTNKIDVAKIKALPVNLESDIIKTLKLLPGVVTASERSSGFNVRGGAFDQNLILLDGTEVFNPSHVLGFFSVFNSDAIKSLKLYKGGIPAKYGGRLSSVLEVQQNEGNIKKRAARGGIGLLSSRFLYEAPIKKKGVEEAKSSFMIAGRRSYFDLFLNFSQDEVVKSSLLFFYDLNLKVNYSINTNNRVYLSAYFGRDNLGISNIFENYWGNATLNFRWNHIYNSKLISNISFVFSDYIYNFGLRVTPNFDWNSSIKNYKINGLWDYFLSEKMFVDFGVELRLLNFFPGELKGLDAFSVNDIIFKPKYALQNSAFIGLDHKINDKLSFYYGFRLTHFYRLGPENINEYLGGLPNVFNPNILGYTQAEVIGEKQYGGRAPIISFWQPSPRFNATYIINQTQSIKGSFNRMYQNLHLLSNSLSGAPIDKYIPSGPYIDPAVGNQFTLGYFRSFKQKDYDFSIEAYYKTQQNLIDFIDGAELITKEDVETELLKASGLSYGLETYFSKNTGKLTGWISLTLGKSVRKAAPRQDNEVLYTSDYYSNTYDIPFNMSVVALYDYSERWRLSANFILRSGNPTTLPVAKFYYNSLIIPIYSDRNADRLSTHHRLDISATLTPKKNKNRKFKSKWVFSVYNVYNRFNPETINYYVNLSNGKYEATETTYFKIVPSVSYEFAF